MCIYSTSASDSTARLRVGVGVIVPSDSVRDLGIYLDCDVSMRTQRWCPAVSRCCGDSATTSWRCWSTDASMDWHRATLPTNSRACGRLCRDGTFGLPRGNPPHLSRQTFIIALTKKDGGLRPIVVSMVWRRLYIPSKCAHSSSTKVTKLIFFIMFFLPGRRKFGPHLWNHKYVTIPLL